MEGVVYTSFHATEEPDAEALIEATLDVCRKHGLTESGSDAPVDPGTATVSDRNRIGLYWDTRKIEFNFNVEHWESPVHSVLNVTTAATLFRDVSGASDSGYDGRAGNFVDLLRDLAVALDSVYVGTFNTKHGGAHGTPSPETVLARDVPFDLERIPWLGIYSDRLIEQLGGRQQVLETPAWRVEELENGSILIVTTKVPWDGYHETLPADRHLLGGADADDSIRESEPSDSSEPEFSDPFVALEPGEHGTAFGVHPDDIAEEFRNGDLQLVRVCVGEDGTLRRVEDDAFVRHVVELEGSDPSIFKRQLADLPPTASDDALLASALFHGAIPPEFVRLDEPDGENVVSKVADLDADVSKYDLLVRLGDTTRAEDFTEEDFETIEGALDTIRDLADDEDVANVEQLIESRLL